MKRSIIGAAFLGLSLVLALDSCSPKSGEPVRVSHPRILILTDEAGLAGIKKLPSGVEIQALSDPAKEGLSDQVVRVLSGGGVAALIVCPAPEATALAFLKARKVSPTTLLYAGYAGQGGSTDAAGSVAEASQVSGGGLLLESSADLVAELGPGSDVTTLFSGLAELARRAIPGKVKSDNLEEFLAALRAAAPGRGWTGAYYKDPDTGIKARNHVVASPSTPRL